jgi:hypothetical protein
LCRRLLIEVTLIAYYINREILIAEKLTSTPLCILYRFE